MKIGIFDPYLDDLGGGEKYMMTMASCLAKSHEVSIFWDNPEDIKILRERFILDFSGIHIVPNIFSKEVSFFKRLWETRKYDITIMLSDGSLPLSLSKKLFIHIQQPLYAAQNIKTRLKIMRVTAFFCNSKFTRSFIDRRFHVKSKVIYPPIELHAKNRKKENIILHVGRFRVKNVDISDYKKQAIMIKTFKKMVDKGLKQWKFILAVSVNPKESDVFEKVKSEATGYPIDFIVNENNVKLWELYNSAKIYWHATGYDEDFLRHPEYAEHFGISTVEAMGGGAVPVVINAGGQKEIVEDGINGLVWNTLDQLVDKTLNLIRTDKLLKKLSDSAVKSAQKFAGDRFCKEIEAMING